MNARFMTALILPVFLSLSLVAVVPTPGPTLQIHERGQTLKISKCLNFVILSV